jgi:uncharacterized SAM-binding protein YcdF (DUF218 family)
LPAQQGRLTVTAGSLAFFGATSVALIVVLLDQLGLLWLLPAARGRELWIVLGALPVGAFLGITKANRLIHAAAGLVLLLWIVVSTTPVAGWLTRGLQVAAAPAPADAVVVLASYIQPDGDLSAQSEARLLRGLELLHGKFAPRLVVTDLLPPTPPARETAAAFAGRLGIPATIESVGPVRNTHDEAVQVARLAREGSWKCLLLVTSPTHMRRALATFRKAAGPGLEVVPVPARETEFDLERLGDADDRRRAFGKAVHETIGLWVYRLRGWA